MKNILQIPYSKITIDAGEIDAAINCMKSGWVTTGQKSFLFEKAFSEYVGSRYGVAVSSCTAALHLSLIVLGVHAGDEVIMSPMTFVSSANVVEYCNAKPVFADIDSHTFNITSESIEKVITKKTKAIIVVHYAGHPCDMDSINELAQKFHIPVIEDAAHAIGSVYRGKKIGNSNNLVCFSFYPTKSITTVEGGMITTNNEEYIEQLKRLRLHGMDRDAWKRYGKTSRWEYDVDEIGYKYNMPDLFASIGIEQLKKIESFQTRRQEIGNFYDNIFKEETEYLSIQNIENDVIHSRFMYAISLLDSKNREQFIQYLKKNGVQVSVLFKPVYKFTHYKNKYHYQLKDYPICEKFFQGLVCLPIYPLLNNNEVQYIVDLVLDFKNYLGE